MIYTWMRFFAIGYAVFFFFTNIPAYLFITDDSRVPPAAWLAILWVFGLWLSVVSMDARRMLLSPLSIWSYAYIGISCGSALVAPTAALTGSAFSDAVVWAISVIVMQVVFSGEPKYQQFARKAIFLGLILAYAACVFDFLNPGILVPLDHPAANPGRAAGFYVNANTAGFVMVIGTLAVVGILKEQYRPILVAATSGAILLTFSRGSWLVWVCVIPFLIYRKTISFRALATSHLALVAVGLLVATTFKTVQIEETSLNNILERIDWLSNPLSFRDDSALEREQVIRLAMDYFWASPAFGHGLGITQIWEERGGTHNIYMEMLVQFGVLGIPFLAWLFYGVAYKTTVTSRTMCYGTIFAFVLWGFFSHNLLTDYTIPLSFALLSAMGHVSEKGGQRLLFSQYRLVATN